MATGRCKVCMAVVVEGVPFVRGLESDTTGPLAQGLIDLAASVALVGGLGGNLVAVLGEVTLAKGLAALRQSGRRLPSRLERAARAIDGAAAFLRRPVSATATMAAIRQHLVRFAPLEDAPSSAGGPLCLGSCSKRARRGFLQAGAP